jgi:hypothetical protein
VYALSDAKVKVQTFPDGTVTVHDGHAGDLTWRDAITHSAENMGTIEYRGIAVELKPCKQP